MVRGDIVGGIKLALSKGQSLQQAMQSFYNAGYKKEEIEEAARAIQNEGFQTQIIKKPDQEIKKQTAPGKEKHLSYVPPPKAPVQPSEAMPPAAPKIEPEQKIQTSPEQVTQKIQEPEKKEVKNLPQTPETLTPRVPLQTNVYKPVMTQRVSSYGPPEEKGGVDFVTVILIILLVILIGGLISVFFFRESIIQFLNTILD